jgi:flavin-dependent dehydrogenase
MRFDVAIAGGGPAGLVAATLLARGGLRVLVAATPARRAPRPGETLPGAGLRLLRSLELPLPAESEGHRPLTGIASAWDGPPVETDYLRSPDGPAWLIDRAAFDSALARAAAAAGARFVGRRLTAEREGDCWRLDAGLSAGFLVVATGRSAALARRLGARRRTEHDLVALWSVAEGRAPERLARPMIERVSDGWWYAVGLDESRTYAAFHVEAADAPAVREPGAWRSRLRSTRFLEPLLAGAGAFTPPRGSPAGGARLDPCRGEGWAACGDSALAFDPLSSQGLLGAMAGGDMLARALLSEDRERGLADYESRLEEIWRIYRDRREAFYGPRRPSEGWNPRG